MSILNIYTIEEAYQYDLKVEDKVKRRQHNNPKGRERHAADRGKMSGSMEKQTTKEPKSKWSKEPEQKTQRKGCGNSSREFLGTCFKCGEMRHRA